MTILVITTGGTIGAMPYKDLKHQPKVKTMPAKGQDPVRLALQKVTDIKTRSISMEARDSNSIDAAYRLLLTDTIKQALESMVMVTHGSDTMIETANYLQKQTALDVSLKKKTVILTGAMVALTCGPESDGLPNMRFALKQLSQGQIMPGIYMVLSEYQDPEKREGWMPRLYKFEPNSYEKIVDNEDNRRSYIRRKGR